VPKIDIRKSIRLTNNVTIFAAELTAIKLALLWITNRSDENMSELECGPMPNLMVALPNIGGALCSTPQSLADAHY